MLSPTCDVVYMRYPLVARTMSKLHHSITVTYHVHRSVSTLLCLTQAVHKTQYSAMLLVSAMHATHTIAVA